MHDATEFAVDRTAFSIVSLEEADDEQAYWRAKTPQERLYAMELIRQILYGYSPDTARIQRVFEVAQRDAE